MTSSERFEIAVESLLRHEGGYVDDPHDRGGETRWGISRAQYPDIDLKHLSKRQAKEIYRVDYWLRFRLHEIENPVIATKMLDLVVWMGPDTAARMLQTALCACRERVTIDGVIGSQTLAAVNRAECAPVIVAMRALALDHIRGIVERDETQKRFLRGWERRAVS